MKGNIEVKQEWTGQRSDYNIDVYTDGEHLRSYKFPKTAGGSWVYNIQGETSKRLREYLRNH